MNIAEIDEDGNFLYRSVPIEPQTPHSTNMGSPDQSNTVAWTNADIPPQGDSSVAKPNQTRRRQAKSKSQIAKPSFFDLNDAAEDNGVDEVDLGVDSQQPREQPPVMRQSQTLRNRNPEVPDSSPTRPGLRSSRNASHKLTQDKIEIMPKTHDNQSPTSAFQSKSFTGRGPDSQSPGRLPFESSNNGPGFASPCRMSMLRTGVIANAVRDNKVPVQKRPQKKNIPFLRKKGLGKAKPSSSEFRSEDSSEHRSSTEPTGVAGVDQGVEGSSNSTEQLTILPARPKPPQKLACGMRGMSAMKTYKITPDPKTKTRLNPLRLEFDSSLKSGTANGNPFDNDNIPLSAGPSANSAERKARPKAGSQKLAITKNIKSKSAAKISKAAAGKKMAIERGVHAPLRKRRAARISPKNLDHGVVNLDGSKVADEAADDEEPLETETVPLSISREACVPMKQIPETIEISSTSDQSDLYDWTGDQDDDDYVEKSPCNKAVSRATQARGSNKVGISKEAENKTVSSCHAPSGKTQRAAALAVPKPTAGPSKGKAVKACSLENGPVQRDVQSRPNPKKTATSSADVHQRSGQNSGSLVDISHNHTALNDVLVAFKETESQTILPQDSLVPGSALQRQELAGRADGIPRKALIIPFGADGPIINGTKRNKVTTQCSDQRSLINVSRHRVAAMQDMSPALRPTISWEKEHKEDCQIVPMESREKFSGMREQSPLHDAAQQVTRRAANAVTAVPARSLEHDFEIRASSPLGDSFEGQHAVENQLSDATQTSHRVLPRQAVDQKEAWSMNGLSNRSSLKRPYFNYESEDAQRLCSRPSAPGSFAQPIDPVKDYLAPAHECVHLQQPDILRKKAKLGSDVPKAAPRGQPEAVNGFSFHSSDDVFGPAYREESLPVDEFMVRTLRKMAESYPERAKLSVTQRTGTLPVQLRPRLNSRDCQPLTGGVQVARSGVNGRPVQGISPDSSNEDGIGRRGALNAWYHDGKGVDHSCQRLAESNDQTLTPSLDGGVEEVMHRIVTHLRCKSTVMHEVVDDYRKGCSSMVQTMSNKHAQERQQLIDEQQKHQANYVRVCAEARRQIELVRCELDAIQLDEAVNYSSSREAISRLKDLNFRALSH